MKYKVISCAIFQPYIEKLNLDHRYYDFSFLEIQQHTQPKKLKRNLQSIINQSQCYDMIILLYGLCGGAIRHLYTPKKTVVVVKVHDCMSILLGSKIRYQELTKDNPSLSWTCYALMKDHYVNDAVALWQEMYEPEEVEYLKSVLVPENPLYLSCSLPEEQEYIAKHKTVIQGTMKFLDEILKLQSKDLIFLNPGQIIEQDLDNQVIKIVTRDRH